jgi:Skp family chaperone for outer membrane proteins
MTRLTAPALAVLLASGLFAEARAQTTGQTTPPTTPPQKPPATAPATQTPAPTPAAPTPAPMPFPTGATVAYIRMQAAVAESKFGKCGGDTLKALREKKAALLAPKQRELDAINQRIQAQQGVVAQAVMVQLARDRDRIQREGQALAAQFQTDEDNQSQDLLSDFQGKVVPMLEQLRKDKGLSLILWDVTGAILVANPALDLTGELVTRLDAAYPTCTAK